MFRLHMTSSKPTWPLGCKENPEKQCGRCDKQTKFHLQTWFTWQIALRNSRVLGPRGGKYLEEFARYVYYKDGRFWKTPVHKNPDKNSTRDQYATYEPINGIIWTEAFPKFQRRHDLPDCSILCRDGYPVNIELDGDTFEVDEYSWPTMEAVLGLNERWRKAGRKAS